MSGWAALVASGFLVAGCAEGRSAVEPSGANVGSASQTDIVGVGPELAAVRAATAKYHDAEVAAAAGYHSEGEPCVASPAGTMGIHAPNLALIGSQALDPEQPEALLYLEKPGGGLRLVAVEYVQIVLLRNPATGVVGPWLPSTPWPSNYQVVTPTPKLFGQTFDGPMPGHNPQMPWHWDLHVWVWVNNPSGMFAQWNPSISCR
jgi:hypothetical protein